MGHYGAALSADGTTALVGGPGDGSGRGAAWVFVRSGGVWRQQGGKLTGGGTSRDFGWQVALSADANTSLIGDPLDNGRTGAAWVFARSGGVWRQQGGKLTGGSGTFVYGEFGWAVARAPHPP